MTYFGPLTDFHVLPINDLRPHRDSRECWCKPDETEPGVWVHKSMEDRKSVV